MKKKNPNSEQNGNHQIIAHTSIIKIHTYNTFYKNCVANVENCAFRLSLLVPN